MLSSRTSRGVPPRPDSIVPPTTLGVINVTSHDVRELVQIGNGQKFLPLTAAAVNASWITSARPAPRQTESKTLRPSTAAAPTTYARFFEPPPAAVLSATTAERLRRMQMRSTFSPRSVLPVTSVPMDSTTSSSSPHRSTTASSSRRPPRTKNVPSVVLPAPPTAAATSQPRVPFQPKPYDEYDLEKRRNRCRLTTEDRILAREAYEEKLLSQRSILPTVF